MNRQFIDKSFYEWCMEHNHYDYIDRWNYNMNKCSPQDVSFSSNMCWWFNCEKHADHHPESKKLNSITSGRGSMKCKQCNSFGQWCLDNDHKDLINRWDNTLNKISLFEVAYTSHSKYYFKCPICKHESSLKEIGCIVGVTHGSVGCVGCESFGEWATQTFGDIFWTKYWDNSNTVNPWIITKRSNITTINIMCLHKEYHGTYQITPDAFYRGRRCPFCGHNQLHILDSLGNVYPQTTNIWSKKNEKSPYEYTCNNDSQVWWKCENGIHGDYQRRIADSTRKEFRCPDCVNERTFSLLQEKVSTYISEKYGYEILHEHKCKIRPINVKTKMPMPYDNEIVDLKLIIEVNGQQHYDYHFFKTIHKITIDQAKQELQELKERDKQKEIYALSMGYHYLVVPYWSEKDEEYKFLIDEKINSICN